MMACSLKSSQSNRWIGKVLAVVVVVAVAEAVDGIDGRSSTVSQIGVTAATTAALLVAGEGACCIPRVVIVGRQCGHAGGESVE
jgi:hypothetical protein